MQRYLCCIILLAEVRDGVHAGKILLLGSTSEHCVCVRARARLAGRAERSVRANGTSFDASAFLYTVLFG